MVRNQQVEATLSVVNGHDRLLLLGKPGSGKTTFTKFVVLSALKNELEKPHLPIWVGLKAFADSGEPLFEHIIKIFDQSGLGHHLTKAYLQILLESGNCVVLLDGLDEVTARPREVIMDISQFVKAFPGNKYVLTCRLSSYNHAFGDFTTVELADLTDEQVQEYVKRWYKKKTDVADKFWRCLNDPANAGVKELATIPILLNLLCITFGEHMQFPINKAELYEKALAILLSSWDAERAIQREEVYKGLSLDRKEVMLSRMAYATFSRQEYFVEKERLESLIRDYIGNLLGSNQRALREDSAAVLQCIAAYHGLLVERSASVFSFSHLTFQEYFTAKHIVITATEGSLAKLVEVGLFDPVWREVFLLVASKIGNAGPMLRMVREALSELAKKNRILLVMLSDAHKIARLSSEYSRSVCVACALHAIVNRIIDIDTSLGTPKHNLMQCAAALTDLFMELSTGKYSSNLTNPDYTGTPMMVRNKFIYVERLDRRFEFDSGSDRDLSNYVAGTKILLDCLNSDAYLDKKERYNLLNGLMEEGRQENF